MEEIIWFSLSEEGLKQQVQGGERWIGYALVPILLLVAGAIYLIVGRFNFWLYLLLLMVIFAVTELTSFYLRKQRFNHWWQYKIGYENDVLVEERNGEPTAQNIRNQIIAIRETKRGLKKEDHAESILLPYDLENYEELEHRLRNWDRVQEIEDSWVNNVDELLIDWFWQVFAAPFVYILDGFIAFERKATRKSYHSHLYNRSRRLARQAR